MAIPRSDLPGHRQLKERIDVALGRCEEATDTDFKASAPWENLRTTITKTAMAMANQRDGGVIIIGVSEDKASWKTTGIQIDHLGTYSPDTMADQINRFASPPLRLTVVVSEYEAKQFLAIQVHEFDQTPVICQRNGDKLTEGAVYVRPRGTPRSERPANALEMEELLGLAGEKRARRILETARRVGLAPTPPPSTDFDRELEGL